MRVLNSTLLVPLYPPVHRFASNVVFDNCDTNVFRDNFGRLR